MKKKLAILLVLTLVFSLLVPLTAQAAGSQTVRIGLAYGSAAEAATSLRSKSGTGYSFGYYDGQRQFVGLGWTGESAISVLITQNQYLTGSGGYAYASDGRGAVGCYHVQLPGSYADFDSALAVASQLQDGFVAWIQGEYYVRVGSYTRRSDAEAAAAGMDGAGLGETSGYGYVAVATGTTRILFQFDANQAGETGAFGVQPWAGEGEKAVTVVDEGRSYYGGFRFERINGGESTVVNMIELEDYVKGVVPYEMSPSWPLEALKAQAVCARTYALGGTRHSDYHFDLCPTTHCQAYKGTSGAGAASDQAVEETAGQGLYYNGKSISGNAVYYSSNGGASEDVKNVWGSDHGYLKGKIDPYEEYATQFMTKSQLSYYRWTKTYTASSLKARLHEKGYICEDIVSFTTKESDVGNVISFTVTDTKGKSYTFSRDKIRSILAINSIRFKVSVSGGSAQASGYALAGAANVSSLDGLYAIGGDGSVAALPQTGYVITENGVEALEPVVVETGSAGGETVYTLNGTGWGHNVGMSQWGAFAMAKQGYTYQDILKFYYTDITIQ